MQRDIRRLKNKQFYIPVGGISGAAVAWDAALRGYDVALSEKKDYGHATSTAISKLIHGGRLRYLAGLDFTLMRESLRERWLLSQNAPLESTLRREVLKGAFYYYDGLNKHPERINIDFLHSAKEQIEKYKDGTGLKFV